MHVAIAGNIGSGKTTLTKALSDFFKWEPHYEDVDDNPYLRDFYGDMLRWSFNLQIYFLNSRFNQVIDFRKSGKKIIQDRTIYEDAYIFAPNLYEMNLMSERDFRNYRSLFDIMINFVQPPDLLIYLKASVPTLVRQIQKRGRSYENTIRLDYLTSLNKHYESWIKDYKLGELLVVDVDNIDFAENKSDLNAIIDKVGSQLRGLF